MTGEKLIGLFRPPNKLQQESLKDAINNSNFHSEIAGSIEINFSDQIRLTEYLKDTDNDSKHQKLHHTQKVVESNLSIKNYVDVNIWETGEESPGNSSQLEKLPIDFMEDYTLGNTPLIKGYNLQEFLLEWITQSLVESFPIC